jgi:hypothetical protein
MDKIRNYIGMVACGLITIVGLACNCSDYSEDLGDGYTYMHEGQGCNTIFHKRPAEGGKIPPDVLSFDYDKHFIIAMQKLQKEYKEEITKAKKTFNLLRTDSIRYWIIIKKEHKVLGPLTATQFNYLRIKHNVPEELVLH